MAELKIKASSGSGSSTLKSGTTDADAIITLPTATIDFSTAGDDGQFLKTNGSGTLSFATVSTDPTTTSGTNNFTVADGDLVIGTSGHGISFAATSDAGGMTSELLDDYEEGTYTPSFSSGSGSFTQSVQQGRYVKIGQLVYCTFRVDWTGGSPTGAMFVSTPFTTTNSTAFGLTGAGGVSYNASFEDAYALTIGIQGNHSTTGGKFYARSSDSNTTDPNPASSGRCDGWMMFYV